MVRKPLMRILCLFLIAQFLLLLVPISVYAGDEQNPEITDDENDLFEHPSFPVPTRSLKAIDLVSAWFYENQNESEYLFITLKVVDLRYVFFYKSTYLVEWKHDEFVYDARFSPRVLGRPSVAVLLRSYPSKITLIRAVFNTEDDLVTFKISKNFIGNRQPGDVLTRTRVASALTVTRYNFLDFYIAFDSAPNSQPSGKDYVIQY